MKAYESDEKVKELLKELSDERERLPQFSGFGDNNWEDLDGCTYVLNKLLMDLPVDLDELMDSSDMGYSLSEWIKGGDSQSDIYCDYCG